MEAKVTNYPLPTKITAVLFILLIIYGQFYLLSALGFFQIPIILTEIASVGALLAVLFAGIHMISTLYTIYFKKS